MQNDCNCCKEYKKLKKQFKVKRPLFEIIFGYCPWCERYFRYHVKTVRRNTAYVEEGANWMTACKDCRDEDEAYYAELWADYYSGLL